jgi:hypothetical protein
MAFYWPFYNQLGMILLILWQKPLIFKYYSLMEKLNFVKGAWP